MSEWKEFKLGELCDIRRGASPRPIHDYLSEQGMPWVKISDATSENSRFIKKTVQKIKLSGVQKSLKVNPGDFILSNSATPGIPKFMNIEACIHDGWLLLSNFNKLDKLFLYYFLLHERPNLANQGNGSVFTNLKTDIVKTLKITIPDLPTQTAIAEILSSLDDKIELNNKINQELENLAQTLFKRWFIDFEFPNENGEPYKSSGGEMVDSELGEIPKGWSMKTLDDISNITIGRTPPRKEHQWFSTDVNDIKWISIRDMGNCGTYIHTTSEFLTEDAVSQFNVPVINSNTVIISFKLTVGRISITTERMLSNEAIAHLNLKNKEIYPEFLYLFLKQFNFDSLGSTSSIATAVNSKSIKSLPFINPCKEVLSKFNDVIVPLFSRIHNLTFENKELVDLRDTVLPKLISGELEINEISN
jgi:type I restriction enzyme S subunit